MSFEAHNRGLRLKTEWIAIPCDRWIEAARRKTQSKLNSPINDNQKNKRTARQRDSGYVDKDSQHVSKEGRRVWEFIIIGFKVVIGSFSIVAEGDCGNKTTKYVGSNGSSRFNLLQWS